MPKPTTCPQAPSSPATVQPSRRGWISTALACLLLACLHTPALAADQTITIAKIDHTRLVDQIALAVLNEAYRRINVRLVLKELPPVRALAESSSGSADGEMQRRGGLSAQFPDLIQVNVPINWVDFCVFTRLTNFTPNGWESLRPYRIGFHRGILAIEEGTRGMNIDPADSTNLLLLKLKVGRTDLVVMTESDGDELLAAVDDASIHKLAPPVAHIQLYHYLHRRHAATARKLEQVLKVMEKNGTIAEIRDRTIAAHRAQNPAK